MLTAPKEIDHKPVSKIAERRARTREAIAAKKEAEIANKVNALSNGRNSYREEEIDLKKEKYRKYKFEDFVNRDIDYKPPTKVKFPSLDLAQVKKGPNQDT